MAIIITEEVFSLKNLGQNTMVPVGQLLVMSVLLNVKLYIETLRLPVFIQHTH